MKTYKIIILLAATMLAATMTTACGDDEKNNTSPRSDATLTCHVGDVSFTLVRIEPGSFPMGALTHDTAAFRDEETPVHQVTLSRPYYMGQTEVTQDLYVAVMGVNPSHFANDGNRPVERVSYDDALAFCHRLSELTHLTFTLPTEAQWEYAARGGHKASASPSLFAGDDSIAAVGWYADNSDSTTHTVAQKKANELGLYDMTGNVFEWCLDWYAPYNANPVADPVGPASGSERVSRGGSWKHTPTFCRASVRACSTPDTRYNLLGIRVAMLP